MIKVQPARSRVVKTEGPDHITLEMPAEGVLSFSGLMAFLSLGWIALAVWGGAASLESGHREFAIVAVIAMLPGLLAFAAGVAMCRRRWTIERSAFRITFERRGLVGTSRRAWNVDDVSTVYAKKSDFNKNTILVLGFRNGRSEEVVEGKSEEDMTWVAAMLSDPRGNRRPVPQPPLQAPSAPRVRASESIVPPTLTTRKYPTGAEVTFLALIHFKRRWWTLLAGTVLGVVAIQGVSLGLIRAGWGFPVMTRIGVGVLLLAVLGRILVLSRSAVVQILDGIVTIVQNQARGSHQFSTEEVEYIQTFRSSGDTELQFLLRGKPKLRLFGGRPADELEWAARFLRLALKARPEEAAPLNVDATAGECQVCGEKMETRVVFCAKCRTPHHEECWSYVGQCSTYGCREIRFTRA